MVVEDVHVYLVYVAEEDLAAHVQCQKTLVGLRLAGW
jgi:hypothetical protein